MSSLTSSLSGAVDVDGALLTATVREWGSLVLTPHPIISSPATAMMAIHIFLLMTSPVNPNLRWVLLLVSVLQDG